MTALSSKQLAAARAEMDLQRERSRRAVLMTRALHNPEGLTPYAFTKGMTKADALMFWTDAKALGFITLGNSERGARTFGLRSTEVSE